MAFGGNLLLRKDFTLSYAPGKVQCAKAGCVGGGIESDEVESIWPYILTVWRWSC